MDHMKDINTMRWQDAEFVVVKPGGTYSYHSFGGYFKTLSVCMAG
jgi:hypothetical protein